jgi:acyl-CoA thioester hydrolase
MRIPEGAYVAKVGLRVGYADTDRAQVVHHSTYLRYLEMARVEYLRSRGFDFRAMELEKGLSLTVVEANVRYRAGARFDDLLEIRTWVGEASRAKLRFDSLVMREEEVMTQASITVCCVKIPEARLVSMPPELIAYASG